MNTKNTILIFVLLLCTAIAKAQYQQVNDILYTESTDSYAQERCKLDVYYPTNRKDVPVVVWFHGGGIEGGNKHIDRELRNSGFVVIAAFLSYTAGLILQTMIHKDKQDFEFRLQQTEDMYNRKLGRGN